MTHPNKQIHCQDAPITPDAEPDELAISSHQPPEPKNASWKQYIRIAAWPVTLILLIALAVYAIRIDTLNTLLENLSIWRVIIWIPAIVLQLIFTGLVFWRLNKPFEIPNKPIAPSRMIMMLAASTVLNCLPLPKAGLFARAIYLKKVYGIGYTATAGVFGLAIAQASSVFILLISIALTLPIAKATGYHWTVVIGVGLLVFMICFAILTLWAWRVIPAGGISRAMKESAIWFGLRLADIGMMLTQLWLAFDTLNLGVSLPRLIAIVTTRALLGLIGLTPNGLGLSEWAGAWIASTGILGSDPETTQQSAAAAMLLYQSAALLIFIPLGLISLMILKQDLKKYEDE